MAGVVLKPYESKLSGLKKCAKSTNSGKNPKNVPDAGVKIGHLNQYFLYDKVDETIRTGGKDMIKMAQLEDIKKMYFMEGLSIREIN